VPSEFPFSSRRSAVYAANGMVATSQPLASEAGVAMLRAGGNAVDAAASAAAVLAVTEPCSCGLGGDAFALCFRAKDGSVTALNGSGRAPARLSIDAVRRDGIAGDHLPARHAHAVTVPGAVAALCDLVEARGSLPLATILGPAIELAERGFPVAPITAYHWQQGAESLAAAPGGHRLLLGDRAPRAGELIRNRDQADVLRAIVEGGKRAFYEGDIAARIADAVQAAGGALSTDDMAGHRSTWDAPISASYRGVRLWECPPNSQGLAALLALSILRHCDIGRFADPLAPERLHLVIEALRLAFADSRSYVADPGFARTPLDELLDDDYAARRARDIDVNRANPNAVAGSPTGGSDTVYLSCADRHGDACSFIFSNYMGFGTGIVPAGCGFPLQNRGAGFVLRPDHPNALAPRKRPYHTIIPAMATRESDGSLFASFGVMGGFMQPQGHVQVLLGLIDGGLDAQAALDAPRVCLEGGDAAGSVALEEGIPDSAVSDLARRGHDVRRVTGHDRALFGRGQVVTCASDTGVYGGGSDPRADGLAIGL